MKKRVYIQFFHNGTGYIPGSQPPRFSQEYIKPVEICGSDGVSYLDMRFGFERMILEANSRLETLSRFREVVGLEIRRTTSHGLEPYVVIYSTIKTK